MFRSPKRIRIQSVIAVTVITISFLIGYRTFAYAGSGNGFSDLLQSLVGVGSYRVQPTSHTITQRRRFQRFDNIVFIPKSSIPPFEPFAARTWANLGNDFATDGNWTGGGPAPGSGDVALFASAPSVQPQVTLSQTIAGLRFSSGTSGYDITNLFGAVLGLNGTSTSGASGTATSSASAIRNDNTSGTTTVDAPLTLASSTLISTIFQDAADGSTLVLNGAIGESGSVALSMKNGTIQLNHANAFSGGSSIDAAGTILIIGDNGALGSGTFTNNATSTIQAGSASRTITNNVILSGDMTVSGANNLTFNGSFTSSGSNARLFTVNNPLTTLGGNVFLSESNTLVRSLSLDGSGDITISGNIANNNGGNTLASPLSYQGSGTVTLSGTNTYTGNTTIRSGTFKVSSIGDSGSTGNLGAGTTINLGSTLTTGTLVYTGTGESTSKAVNLNGTSGGAVVDQSGTGLLKFTATNLTAGGAGSKTLTLQGSTAGTGEMACDIKDNSGTNKTSLTKTGTGSWTLSAANDYSGPTAINGGKLFVNGTTAPGSTFAVNNTGTLGGTGSVLSPVTVASGGTVAPGSSPGILNIGNVTNPSSVSFSSGSTFAVEIGGTTPGNGSNNHDQLNVTGTVSLGNATLNVSSFNGFVPSSNQTFTIILNDGTGDAVTGTFNGLAEGATISTNFLSSGLTAKISYVGGDGNDVVISVLAPTAASVSISGRVVSADGRAVPGALVTVSGNGLGMPITVRSGPSGRYVIRDLDAGQTYIVSISSKRFRFRTPDRLVNLGDDLTGFDFIAIP